MNVPRCATCGSPLPADAPPSSCPFCLLRAGLDGASAATGYRPLGESMERVAGSPRVPFGRGPVLASLSKTIGNLPRVLLRDTDPAGGLDVVRPNSPEMPAPGDRPDRLQLLGEIARGGMGAVLRGRDADIGRDVAVKLLLERHEGYPELVRRFVEEAQIAGQLQHPGIVPVYELGTLADRRPYFAMKLVKGRTLATLLAERGSPADDRPRFLAVFEQVCQTVGYAHSRGVIHRDLKPSNIMVGAFGEVQVMDWGLAKVLPEGGASDDEPAGRIVEETLIQTSRSGADGDRSQAGSVLGTPSYMAPEQAVGDVGVVDRRADVFGLGSILCEILTGAPAFAGRSSGEILQRARRGDTADALARLGGCGADPELIDLVRDCLAAVPEDRPRDAGVVAARLTGYLAGVQERLHAARIAGAEERARAESERAKRRLAVALACSLVTMIVLAGGGWAWASSRRAEQVAARTRDVNDAVAEAKLHQGRARASAVEDLAPWTLAAGAGKRAGVLLAGGEVDPSTRGQTVAFLVAIADESRAAEGRAASARAERRLAERLAAIRDEFNIHLDLRRRTADVSSALRDYGVDIATLGPAEAGRRVAASPHADEVVDELDESIFWQRGSRDVEGERRFLAVAEAADRDPWRREVRAASARGDVTALKKLSEGLDFDKATARGILNLAAALTDKAEYPRALELLQALQRRHPDDYWVNFDLALGLINRPNINRYAEASRYAAVAVALRPDAASGHCLLGNLSRREDAVHELREALRINPRFHIAQLVLGKHLLEMGRLDEAVAAERTSVEVAPVLQLAHGLLGTGLRRQGRYGEAKAAFAKAAGLRPVPGFNWPYPLDRLSDECDRMKALAPRFERLVSGEEKPSSNPERLALARLCADRGRHAAAVRLWSEAFATEPALGEDTATWLRFSAASSALLVGLGEAKDEPPPDEGGRSKSLRLALDWLKADVATYARRAAEGGPRERAAAYDALDYWNYGPGVMRLYFPEDLARLPRPERDDWRALWDDVLAAQVKALGH